MVVSLLLVVKQGLTEWCLDDIRMTRKKQPCNYLGTRNFCAEIMTSTRTQRHYELGIFGGHKEEYSS